MFKAARWRSERNKISAVMFKLQFYVTQASQFGGNVLVLSLVPSDIGKATAKLEKSTIRDGCCYWEFPVYETVKLVRDQKTGKIHDRMYNIIVSTGSMKSSPVGEFSVNIADYAGATKACSVSFPFKNSYSASVLHVTIQRVEENANQRDLDENEGSKLKLEDRSLRRYFSNGDSEDSVRTSSTEDEPLRKTVSHIAGLNGNRTASSGSDITLLSSDSSSGLNTPRELGARNNMNKDHELNGSNYQDQQRTQWDWSLVPANDSSTDNSTNSPRESFPVEKSQLGSDESVEKIKADLVALARKAEVSELELQTLRKQIVKESKRGQELSREITGLKEERDALKEECEKLRSSRRRTERSNLQFEGDPWVLLEEVRQELSYEKDLNANLRVQLQKTQESNAELILAVQDLEVMLEKNDDGNFDQPNTRKLSQKAEEMEEIVLKCQSDDDDEQKALEELVRQHNDARETNLLEQRIMDLSSEVQMYRRDKDELEMQMEQLALDYEILKQEHHELCYRLEQSQIREQLKLQYECSGSYATIHELETQTEKLENELKQQSGELADSMVTIKELEMHNHKLEEELENQAHEFEAHMEAVECVKFELEQRAIRAEETAARYLEMINELKTQVAKLESELKKQSDGFSESLSTIKELETHIQDLEEELEKQIEGFEADLDAVTRAKVEQEQRAIRAEEALRLTRWRNANTAARIQEEFKTLSTQMQSSFEANEKLVTEALAEASELRARNSRLEEMLRKTHEELHSAKDGYEAKQCDLHNDINTKSIQIKEMVLEIEEKSKQIENQRKHMDEVRQSQTEELSRFRTEIEQLTTDNHLLSEKAQQAEMVKIELEKLRTLVKERDLLVQSNGEEGESKEDEQEINIRNLQSEVNVLRVQCDELKHSLFEDEMEKENLRKQVAQLKADLKKKEEAIASIERKLKDNNGRATAQDRKWVASKNAKSEPALHNAKEVATLKERIKLLEGQIKSKETALETSMNAFLAKEKNLYNKIGELETRLDDCNHSSSSVSKDEIKLKVSIGMQVDGKDDDIASEGATTICENLNNVASINGYASNEEISSETQEETHENDRDQRNFGTLLKEMVLLKERNSTVESELKEMQQRYSEISLKFAEVEGERQQLVMRLRNIKNAKKC